ncbi:hypothetical protein [Pontibacter russatus]|uniref:hypothetical protein n=1 Tax=Pontibacter russatus TaxID=2694929 RepID=UPI0013795C66|nr:hypothetical protein [Pontibacter russatus]
MARIACSLPLKLSTIKTAINSAYTKLSECVAGATNINKSLAFPMSRFRCWTNMQASQGDASYLNKTDTVGTITWASQLTNNPAGTGPVTVNFSLWRGGVKIQDITVQHPEGVFKKTFPLDYAREAANYGLTLRSEPGEGYFLWTDPSGNPSQMSQTVLAKVAAPAPGAGPELTIRASEVSGITGERTLAFEVIASSAPAAAVSGDVSHVVEGAAYPDEPFTLQAGQTISEVFRMGYVRKTAAYTVTVAIKPSAAYTTGTPTSVTVTIPAV